MNATASDETNTNDSDESLSENGNYMAFATPIWSGNGSRVGDTLEHVESFS